MQISVLPADVGKALAVDQDGNLDLIPMEGAEATARLDVFDDANKGLAPASGGGTTNFLRADGTWTSPGSGLSQAQVLTRGLGA